MSIFKSIMSKIFHRGDAQQTAGAAPASSGTPATKTAQAPAAPSTAPAASSGAATSPQGSVDVEAILTDLAGKAGQKLDWRRSIVDLMKLLGLDSSLAARKELAAELKYTGDTNDSATMNIWLHKQVMRKLAENGGKVPEELRT
jgi:hypothetical protein